MIARTLIVLATLALLTPIAAAQAPLDPALAHVDETSKTAQADPVGYATDKASEEGVAQEAEWGVAYTCYVGEYAHDEAGTPRPQLEQCDDYEEVLGIEEEEEAPVAEVEELADDPVAQVEDLEEETLALVDDILEDPQGAPEAILAFIDDLLDRVGDLVDGLVGTVGDLLDGVGGLVGAALKADAGLGEEVYDGALDAVDVAGAGVSKATDNAVMAIQAPFKAIGDAIDDAGKGVESAGDAVADVFDTIGDAVTQLVDRLLGQDDDRTSQEDGGELGRVERTGDDVLGVVDDVTTLVDDTV